MIEVKKLDSNLISRANSNSFGGKRGYNTEHDYQNAAYIPMPKGRGFTPHFDKTCRRRWPGAAWALVR